MTGLVGVVGFFLAKKGFKFMYFFLFTFILCLLPNIGKSLYFALIIFKS